MESRAVPLILIGETRLNVIAEVKGTALLIVVEDLTRPYVIGSFAKKVDSW